MNAEQWRAFLADPAPSPHDLKEAAWAAGRWSSCAVGALFPDVIQEEGSPSGPLYNLGVALVDALEQAWNRHEWDEGSVESALDDAREAFAQLEALAKEEEEGGGR